MTYNMEGCYVSLLDFWNFALGKYIQVWYFKNSRIRFYINPQFLVINHLVIFCFWQKENSSLEITIVGKEKCNQISFKSKKCFKGNSADIMISRHLGPNFVDKNMSVFVGDIRLRYTDPICRPSNKATPYL